MFVELAVVSVGGKSGVVFVLRWWCGWKECVEVLVALAKCYFVEKTKHRNVTS